MISFFFDTYKNKFFKVLRIGSKGYDDYTISNNDIKKNNYIKRHYVNENWSDIESKGFWSRFLLWQEKTIPKSIQYIRDKFGLDVVYLN